MGNMEALCSQGRQGAFQSIASPSLTTLTEPKVGPGGCSCVKPKKDELSGVCVASLSANEVSVCLKWLRHCEERIYSCVCVCVLYCTCGGHLTVATEIPWLDPTLIQLTSLCASGRRHTQGKQSHDVPLEAQTARTTVAITHAQRDSHLEFLLSSGWL